MENADLHQVDNIPESESAISEYSKAAGAEEFIEKPYWVKQMRQLVNKHTHSIV